jgi:NAD(P)H-dependent FMN reductase
MTHMVSVLGVVGSARPWGNSELLVRQVLRGAQAEGAAVEIVRLTALRIEPCTGCMRCVIGGERCPLPDDMGWLIERMQAADGMVLAAPIYWLGAAATIKLVLDRLLMVTGRVDEPLPLPRPAVTIATAGLDGWRGVALAFLNALAAGFGYRPVESLVAIAPGPGEVLLDDALMARMLEAGRRLTRGDLVAPEVGPGVCPVCHCEAFILQGRRAVCPICGREAAVQVGEGGVGLHFGPVAEGHQRWTPEGLREHMIGWVQATGPRYMARRAEIKERRAAFRQTAVSWICPPAKGEG